MKSLGCPNENDKKYHEEDVSTRDIQASSCVHSKRMFFVGPINDQYYFYEGEEKNGNIKYELIENTCVLVEAEYRNCNKEISFVIVTPHGKTFANYKELEFIDV